MQDIKQKELETAIAKDNLIIESLEQWVTIEHEHKDLENLFVEMGYRTIAIYGYGHLGKLLEKILKSTEIIVAYVMDIRFEDEEGYYKNPYGNFPETDAVIVTNAYYYAEIRNQLKNAGCKAEIRLFDELLYQL